VLAFFVGQVKTRGKTIGELKGEWLKGVLKSGPLQWKLRLDKRGGRRRLAKSGIRQMVWGEKEGGSEGKVQSD